jgi:hypothetical protein
MCECRQQLGRSRQPYASQLTLSAIRLCVVGMLGLQQLASHLPDQCTSKNWQCYKGSSQLAVVVAILWNLQPHSQQTHTAYAVPRIRGWVLVTCRPLWYVGCCYISAMHMFVIFWFGLLELCACWHACCTGNGRPVCNSNGSI